MGSQRVGHNWNDLACRHEKKYKRSPLQLTEFYLSRSSLALGNVCTFMSVGHTFPFWGNLFQSNEKWQDLINVNNLNLITINLSLGHFAHRNRIIMLTSGGKLGTDWSLKFFYLSILFGSLLLLLMKSTITFCKFLLVVFSIFNFLAVLNCMATTGHRHLVRFGCASVAE